ncbi:hypothetical protein GQ457_11G016200 [Hibiscus cannabinus]
MPIMQQNNRMMNQESFPLQWLAKSIERLQKRVMFQHLGGKGLQNLEEGDLNELGWLIQQNLKDISNRIDMQNFDVCSRVYSFSGIQITRMIIRIVSASIFAENEHINVCLQVSNTKAWNMFNITYPEFYISAQHTTFRYMGLPVKSL